MDLLLFAVLGLVAALCGGAIVTSGRRAVFWLAFGSTLIPLGFVDRYYLSLPSPVKWLSELCLVGAAIGAVALAPRERSSVPRRVLVAVGLVFALAGVSWLANRSSLAALVVSLRGFVLFFAALAALRAVYPVYDKDRLMAFLVNAGIASSFVCLAQRATIAPGQADRVTGLFSLGEIMLFFHLLAIGITVLYWTEGRSVVRWNGPLVVIVLVVGLAVGNQEAAIPYLALLLGYLVVRAQRHRWALVGGGLALGALMLGIFTFFYDSDYSEPGGRSFSDSIFSWDYVQRYVFGEGDDILTPGGDLLRGAAVRVAYEQVAEDPQHLLVGRGPGATSESGIAGATGPMARALPGIGRVTLSLLLGDSGLGGTLLYSIFLLSMLAPLSGPGRPEPWRHARTRELFVLLSLAFLMYARLCYEPGYAWALATMLYPFSPRGTGSLRGVPSTLGVARPEAYAQGQAQGTTLTE